MIHKVEQRVSGLSRTSRIGRMTNSCSAGPVIGARSKVNRRLAEVSLRVSRTAAQNGAGMRHISPDEFGISHTPRRLLRTLLFDE
jgi:hypothetical protein